MCAQHGQVPSQHRKHLQVRQDKQEEGGGGLDQIETLQVEINNWELKNRNLEEEVVALKAEKEELQYILAAHMSTCALQVKVELASEEESPVFVQVQPSQETVKPQRPKRPGSLSLQSVGASQDQPPTPASTLQTPTDNDGPAQSQQKFTSARQPSNQRSGKFQTIFFLSCHNCNLDWFQHESTLPMLCSLIFLI